MTGAEKLPTGQHLLPPAVCCGRGNRAGKSCCKLHGPESPQTLSHPQHGVNAGAALKPQSADGDFPEVRAAGNLSCGGQRGTTQVVRKLAAFTTKVALLLFFLHQRWFFSLAAPSLLISQPAAPCRQQTRLAADWALVPVTEGFVCAGAGTARRQRPSHCAALFAGTLQHLGWLCFSASCVSRSACLTMGDKRKIVSRLNYSPE